jgi:hypothetical protein
MMFAKSTSRWLRSYCCGGVTTLLLLTAGAGWAQSSGDAADTRNAAALLQRVQDLENQVANLKAQVQQFAGKANSLPAAPAAAGAPVPETAEESTSEPVMDGLTGPHLQLRGYADVDWHASDQKGSTNSFLLGQFNLFITSHLTDHASFLSETILEADQQSNDFAIDVERLELIYALSDRLTLQFGRFHTAIGFYNTAYHHSAVMQTTLGRPFLFAFEDAGGLLPIHSVGASATGIVSHRLGLHYIAEIGNGRDPRTGVNPVQNVRDDNNGKAFNVGFFVRPEQWSGFQFGVSNYHDHITPPGVPNVSEDVLAAHVVYQNSRFEFLNEAVWLRHTSRDGARVSNTSGLYSQISQRFGNYRPYFRYEYLNVPISDPLYSDIGLLHGPKAGLRYELNEFTAFKIEFGRTLRRGLDPINSLGTQLAFAF